MIERSLSGRATFGRFGLVTSRDKTIAAIEAVTDHGRPAAARASERPGAFVKTPTGWKRL